MIKWLHISDLHIRNQADWNNSKKELYKKCAEIGKIDFVVVTGDFHDFSDKKDFSNAMAFLRELMNKLGLDILRDLFLIPGNHDGVSEIEYKDEMLVAAKARPLEIGKRVDELLKMFSDYEVFVRELIPSYPCEHPATVHIRSWNNQINLIHCNTALGADGETKIDQVLDIDGLSNLDVKGECPTVILAHNDFFDLNKQQQSRIKDFIFVNDIRAYLCGDKHKQSVKQITYRNNQNKQIPCIVSYKSAPDSSDKYSVFGIIVGTWENETATLEGWKWRSGEGFKVDSTIGGQEIYMGSRPSEKRTAAPNAKSYRLLEEYSGWRQIATVNKAKNIILSMKRFLQGHPCTWALAFSNILVERQQLDDLVQYIKSGGLYALLGAGAEGKSTLLKQVCVRLYYEGYTVLFHNKEENYVLPKDLPKDTVLVIDEPDDNGFQSLIEFAHDSEIPLIFAARRNEWNLFCKRNHILSETQRSITEIEVQNITDRKEAEAFADCVIKYCNLQAEREKLVEIFLRNGKDYGYLYAAMLLSIHNKEKLEDIATDIIDNIRDENNEAMKLLAYAVLHEHVGISLGEKEYKMFLSKLGLKPRMAKEALELELRQSGKHWETRHPQISDLFYNYFFGESGEYNMSETDSLRWEVLNSLLQKYCNSNYKEKEYIFEDVLNAIQLVNEGTEISDILERLIEEFRLDPEKLCKINSKLESDRHRETFGNLCYTHGIYYEKLLLGWATAANNMNGAGSYEEENSALWIYKKACIERKITDPGTWIGWAKLENETNGAGSYEEENSALWIYKKACIERKITDPGTWIGWAKLENEINGAGSYEEENSELWIYKTACIERKISALPVWMSWVTHVKYNALCSRGWTVDKIYQRALEITNREEVFLYSYAKFLMNEGQFEESRSVIRELYLRDRKYLVSLLFVEMIAGNHDLNSGFCVEKLVHKAELHVSYSFGDQYALYVYYRFQKNEELAKKYYDMFDVSNDKNTHFIESLEKFFITCQNAFGFK